MKNIAIIPARSGSKGLPDKNILELKGKPLIAYTIEHAAASGQFDEIMVSTDSNKYADIAVKFGASVPFLRSEALSSDTAASWDVVREVIMQYKDLGHEFDSICLLQPTSPLRNADDIINAYKLFNDKADVAVISVCEMEHTPKWCNTLPEDNSLDAFILSESNSRRQNHDTFYRLNGAIYIAKVCEFLSDPNLYRKGSYAYIMPQTRSVDIDSYLDFMYAEFLLNNMNLLKQL